MSNVQTRQPQASTGAQIARARRAAGLTQRDLAERLGVPLWAVARLEDGATATAEQLETISALTGASIAAPRIAAPRRPAPVKRQQEDADPQQIGKWVVAISLCLLVLIRFFSEKAGILPFSVSFVDVPVLALLLFSAVVWPARQVADEGAGTYVGMAGLFFAWCALSSLANLERVEPGPVLLFIYGFVAPFLVYAAVSRIWPTGNLRWLTQLLVLLAAVQLVVAAGYDLPRFISSANPDVMSGTFGENGYQLVIFIFMVTTLLAGSWIFDPGTLVSRLAPGLIAALAVLIFLVQFRAFLLTLFVTLVLLAFLMGRGAKGVIVSGAVALVFVLALSYVAREYGLKYVGALQSLTSEPTQFAEARYGMVEDVAGAYSDAPIRLVTGTGPGTFSSRSWRTFAESDRTKSSTASPLAQKLTDGPYVPDVAAKYTLPRYQSAETLGGSAAVTQPFSSYTALAAETGLPGTALMLGAWFLAFLAIVHRTRIAIRRRRPRDPLPQVMLATVAMFAVLLQLAVLENWLEVARMTFICWTLFAIANKEYMARAEPAA